MTQDNQTKKQFYHYTLRSAGTTKWDMCEDKVYAYILPPENALSIENLNCHFKITFDSGVSSGNREVEEIGIASEVPAAVADDATYLRTLTINETADANRVVDINIDLTSLLKKDNVALDADPIGDFIQNNMTMVYIQLPVALRGNSNVGIINLWKIDALFTTTEIR